MNRFYSRIFFFFLLCFLCVHQTNAQLNRLGQDVQYRTQAMGTFSDGDFAPFWFSNNRYGLSTIENNSGLLRVGVFRGIEADCRRNWRVGYGVDLAVPLGMPSNFVLQQFYGDVQWKAIRLSVGQKERPLELKNEHLSSGAATTGINARPLPQVRLELPEFWIIPRTKDFLALKGHVAYGWYTDNAWQRDFNAGNTTYVYSANSLYHSKAAFLRVGNTKQFPLTFTGGFEMSAQFGGEAWNLLDRLDHQGAFDSHQKMGNGLKEYWHAFIPGGEDANDGDYKNCAGNQLGSWHVRFDYQGSNWSASLYGEHFFEDESQLFWQYGWKDMLLGAEVNLPSNPFVSTIVYEYLHTTDQSGSVYHDATETLPFQISAVDEYYNHHIYGAWQHAGFVMGNPLLVSPIYNGNNRIMCFHNRVKAHHFGISGQPIKDLGYRVLFTHERSLGTYLTPVPDPLYGNFLLVEATYSPHSIQGLSFTASYGQNGGKLLGNSKGGMLSVAYSGWWNKNK